MPQQLRHMEDGISSLLQTDMHNTLMRQKQEVEISRLRDQVHQMQQLIPSRQVHQLHELPDTLRLPTPRPSALPSSAASLRQSPANFDRFSDQMQDLKAHLAYIEMKMATAMESSEDDFHWTEDHAIPMQEQDLSRPILNHGNPRTIPCPMPALAQPAAGSHRYLPLAEEWRTMNSRISDLEQTVLELEDKLDDALYPLNKFTPAASVSSTQGSIPQASLPISTAANLQAEAQPYRSPPESILRQDRDSMGFNTSQTDGIPALPMRFLPDHGLAVHDQNTDPKMKQLPRDNGALQRHAEQVKAENAIAMGMSNTGIGKNDQIAKDLDRNLHGQGGVMYRDQELSLIHI